MKNPFRRLPLPVLLAVVSSVIVSVITPSVPTFRRGFLESSTEPSPIVMLLGAVPGLVSGLLLQEPIERLRRARRSRLLLDRWSGVRRTTPAGAEGPVEVVGTIRIITPVTSRMQRRSCAAYVSHYERLDGVVEYHAAIGDVELRAAAGSAWIEAGPCDVAADPVLGEHELRIADGASVVVRAMASRDTQGRVILRGEGERRLVLALAEKDG